MSFVSMFAVLGFVYTSGIVLYQGSKVAMERETDYLEGGPTHCRSWHGGGGKLAGV